MSAAALSSFACPSKIPRKDDPITCEEREGRRWGWEKGRGAREVEKKERQKREKGGEEREREERGKGGLEGRGTRKGDTV